MALFVMACSAAKHKGPCPAGVKYDSRQHRTLFREFYLNGGYACHDALILSAKYGFVRLEDRITDYDLLMDDLIAEQLVQDRRQLSKLRSAIADHDEVYLYGGLRYRDTVKKLLRFMGFTGTVHDVVGPNRGCCDHFAALQAVFYDMSAEA
jgi:hypothetical protein